ncbi:hypothetical protein KAR91_44620 [Candidatus Pacearchaeota archaeon]|nr:hypothetical protein [Candidatus Pacearchaeota archaeon]
MNILDSDIPAFVPEEETKAADILDNIISEGYTVRPRTARGRRNITKNGMVKALAHRLSDIPKVKSIEKRVGKTFQKYYYREV